MKKLAAAAVAVVVASFASLAQADNTECVTSSGVWNAPKGALIVNKGTSVSTDTIGAVLGAIGEYHTHSATSHGVDANGTAWGSMDTMKLPRQYPSGNSSCGHPVEPGDLANGGPGARTDNGGGLWGYYFSNSGFMNGQTTMRWLASAAGSAALTKEQCLTDWEKNNMAGCSGNCGVPYGYSVYAYSAYQNSPSGYGTMCSGLISRSYFYSTASSGTYCTPDSPTTYTYSNSLVNNGANALSSAIQNNSQGFWGTLGACVACFDCNLLDEAADQVVDCFTNNQGTSCSQSNHDWAGNNTYNHTATSISPDRLAGTGVHYPVANTNNNSPWAPEPYNTVYFSSPGNVYGCWY